MINQLRLLSAGKKIFSIALQENVIFEKDVIIKVTNTCYGDDDNVFGTIQIVTGNMPGFIPTTYDKAHGEVAFKISDTKVYTLPEPILHWSY